MINYQIRVPKVRVVDERGKQIGIMQTQEAITEAKRRGYDLALVAERANPPVCRFLNYGQYQYKQQKLSQQQKKKNKKVEVKGIRLTFRMAENDLKIRQKQAEKFLKEGHRVKLEIVLRGRENAFRNLALEKLKKFKDELQFVHSIERPLKKEGLGFNLIIRPE